MPSKKRNSSSSENGDEQMLLKQRRLDAFVQRTIVARPTLTPKKVPKDSSLFEHLIDPEWRRLLAGEFSKDYFKKIEQCLENAKAKKKIVYPERKNIFAALNSTTLKMIKVVIIGQDPYHGPNQAHGYSFSVSPGVPPPPSLRNIFKELESDVDGFKVPQHGCLTPWASQGVLLLNATLTVEHRTPNSHSEIGWQIFTDRVISLVSDHCFGVVFVLWGAFAQKKESLVDLKKHAVIKTAHPSPFSQTKFFGCKCFSKANASLRAYEREVVNWHLPPTMH